MIEDKILIDQINGIIDSFMDSAGRTEFGELDSLDHMELIMNVEEDLDVSIPISDLEGTMNREQMIQIAIDATRTK